MAFSDLVPLKMLGKGGYGRVVMVRRESNRRVPVSPFFCHDGVLRGRLNFNHADGSQLLLAALVLWSPWQRCFFGFSGGYMH